MKELPVGEELNTLLGEHLFEFRISRSMDGRVLHVYKTFKDEDGEYDARADIPDYLDGNGMLKVVGKMRELGYFFKSDVFDVAHFDVHACFGGSGSGSAYGKDIDELPTATGQAALRALGVI